ncbi:hypothetical protein BaRGS_00034286 [Batillaria attramentaria]|uniref:Uncharacterized protein n=1 Tax=Batillaria attramentaria TaxID=370345 RepID=A0ABD0JI06_9CAEN
MFRRQKRCEHRTKTKCLIGQDRVVSCSSCYFTPIRYCPISTTFRHDIICIIPTEASTAISHNLNRTSSPKHFYLDEGLVNDLRPRGHQAIPSCVLP